jgi:transposase
MEKEPYYILKITRPDYDGAVLGEIDRVSTDIVKGDMNNAATLISHGLMDESIFLEEYWWIILRCWDSTKEGIIQRRNSGTGALSYMRNLEKLNTKAENYAKRHFKEDFKEYERKRIFDTFERREKAIYL